MDNIKKAFTCCSPTKQSENNEMDKYSPLIESPTFVKNGQNNAKKKTNEETILHDLPPSLIEMNEEDKKRLTNYLIAEYCSEMTII